MGRHLLVQISLSPRVLAAEVRGITHDMQGGERDEQMLDGMQARLSEARVDMFATGSVVAELMAQVRGQVGQPHGRGVELQRREEKLHCVGDAVRLLVLDLVTVHLPVVGRNGQDHRHWSGEMDVSRGVGLETDLLDHPDRPGDDGQRELAQLHIGLRMLPQDRDARVVPGGGEVGHVFAVQQRLAFLEVHLERPQNQYQSE